ncbi:MAG: TonB-dependent receptor [Bacteroidales bacterium]|nr:TonB-dependent receptor [Bacteroidales bacterium]
MKKLFIAVAALLPLCAAAWAQNQEDYSLEDNTAPTALDSIVVSASRVDAKSPVAFSEMGAAELAAQNPSGSLPMMLNLMPSVVTVNEGGTGLGYSKIRVRGSDPTRMNVTLNGITYNDAESQQVFWVNLPSLSTMLSSAQLQRGVGSSTNGVGAFGASLNLMTAFPQTQPYSQIELAAGSFCTGLIGVKAGTGRSSHGFSLDVDFNCSRTEGYIRNAFARERSFMATGSWAGRRSIAKLIYIYGRQRTGITWNGISASEMAADRRYNSAGEYTDDAGNTAYYRNETDNYRQHNLQANYSLRLADNLYGSATLHYTKGQGFYEQYKVNKKLKNYGFEGSGERSDLVSRKWMDNDLYAASANLKYETWRGLAQIGANYSLYDGDHYGKVLWVRNLDDKDVDRDKHWYDNNGLKKDFSAFAKGALYLADGVANIYGDVQWRTIRYTISGIDDDYTPIDCYNPWNFINAKVGATVKAGPCGNIYASAALAHKEPTRADIKDAITGGGDPVKPERLLDYEFGYRFNMPNFAFAANFYAMEYKDQLVETGKLSDSGYMIKSNIPVSYRRGVELSAGWQALPQLRFDANSTISRNKIVTDEGLLNLMLSPEYIGAFSATWNATRRFTISLSDKVVGKQNYDNTSREDFTLPAYNVLNAAASYNFGKLKLSLFVNNLLDSLYVADAWSYGDDSGFFPAAPINGMLKLNYKF